MTKEARAALQREWVARIADYRASRQTAKAWCAAHNVKPWQLRYWLKKFKTKQNAPSVTAPVNWLPLEVKSSASPDFDSTLLLKVGEVSIEVRPGFDPALLSEVLRVLVNLC